MAKKKAGGRIKKAKPVDKKGSSKGFGKTNQLRGTRRLENKLAGVSDYGQKADGTEW